MFVYHQITYGIVLNLPLKSRFAMTNVEAPARPCKHCHQLYWFNCHDSTVSPRLCCYFWIFFLSPHRSSTAKQNAARYFADDFYATDKCTEASIITFSACSLRLPWIQCLLFIQHFFWALLRWHCYFLRRHALTNSFCGLSFALTCINRHLFLFSAWQLSLCSMNVAAFDTFYCWYKHHWRLTRKDQRNVHWMKGPWSVWQ